MAHLLQQARRVAWSPDRGHSLTPTPKIRRLSRSAPLSLFIEALEVDGCVIVKDFTDISTLERASQEVRPWLDKQEQGAKVGGMKERPLLPSRKRS